MQKDHSAVEPAIRNMWLELHERHADQILNANPQVVFAGDSLTDMWQHQPSWAGKLGKYRPLNLGIGGDRTQHLLWRLRHHVLLKAKIYSILIGTNNISHNSTVEILDGIRACCEEIRRQCPETIILLQKLLPRQKLRSDPAYQQVCEVNVQLDDLIDGTTIIGADYSAVFQVDSTGEAHLNDAHFLPDHVHINEAGYEAWADAMIPDLNAILQEPAN